MEAETERLRIEEGYKQKGQQVASGLTLSPSPVDVKGCTVVITVTCEPNQQITPLSASLQVSCSWL